MMSPSLLAGYALLTGIFFSKENLRYVALSSKTSARFSDSLLLNGLLHVNRSHRAL